jgi:hypothetical protein
MHDCRLNGSAVSAHIGVQFRQRDAWMLLHSEEPHFQIALIARGISRGFWPAQIFRRRLHNLTIAIIGIQSTITFSLASFTCI